jgi:hypothetical protein
VNVSGANVKNKVAVNKAAVNRAGVSKADDKSGFLNQLAAGGNSRRFFVFDTFRPITVRSQAKLGRMAR